MTHRAVIIIFVIANVLETFKNFSHGKKVTLDGTVYSGFKGVAFRRISSHLISSKIVPNLSVCAFDCVKQWECLSFNFANPSGGGHVCELLRTDKYNSNSTYTQNGDFHHFYSSPVSVQKTFLWNLRELWASFSKGFCKTFNFCLLIYKQGICFAEGKSCYASCFVFSFNKLNFSTAI